MRVSQVLPYFGGLTTNNTNISTAPKQNIFVSGQPGMPEPLNKDTFTSQVATNPITPQQKYILEAQDKLLARVLPEKFIQKYSRREFLERAAKANPKVAQLLKKEGLDVKIEPENMLAITKSHLIPTSKYARAIMQNSGEYYTQNDYDIMLEASLIHDLGKALIPSEILNKQGALTPKEREIVKLHNDLGFELLRATTLSPKVLSLIQNHHGYGQKYPKDSMSQILTVADIYSALKEERPYKKAMSDEQAFEILEQGAHAGDYNINYVNSLKKAVMAEKQPIDAIIAA